MPTLRIIGFKGFAAAEVPLRDLTLLTGQNSAGKSSVIQALLLLEATRQSISGRIATDGGSGLRLGEGQDLLNHNSSQSRIQLTILDDDGSISSAANLGVPDERSLHLDILEKDGPMMGQGAPLVSTYLSAERLGPRDTLQVDDAGDASVGVNGEFSAHILAQRERELVAEERRFPDTGDGADLTPPTLNSQVSAWLSHVVAPVLVRAQWISDTSVATVRFRSIDNMSDWRRPSNVGFGYSYVLPIIVAGLTAPAGSTFIVENPEAHLHPAGQSRIGQFLARIAASGVRCVVETHSDHVLNGMRLAVAAGVIDAGRAGINFLSNGAVTLIDVAASGSLMAWPEGFFDQMDLDLSALSRMKSMRG